MMHLVDKYFEDWWLTNVRTKLCSFETQSEIMKIKRISYKAFIEGIELCYYTQKGILNNTEKIRMRDIEKRCQR